MSDAWTVVVVIGACTLAFKALGPLVLGGRELPRVVQGVVALLAPTLLAALVVVSMFDREGEIVLETGMAVGMAAAAAALALRQPTIVVVAAAAASAAVVRLF
jgi:branched-subunit amino acid transport protein